MEYIYPDGTTGITVKNSSQIKEIAFLQKDHRLFIKFHNNDVYSYSPFRLEDWISFQEAESIGSYFYKNIRKNELIKSTKIHNG